MMRHIRMYVLIICVGVISVPGNSGLPHSFPADYHSDKKHVQSYKLLKTISESPTVSRAEHTVDTNSDQEVNKQPVHNIFHASLQSEEHPNVKVSQSSSKFYKSLQSSSKDPQLDLAKSEALSQEVGEGQRHKSTSMSKMVVTLISTVTALVSMSMLVAIFQCCCRRRNRRSSETKGTEDNGQTSGSKNEVVEKEEEEEKPLNEEENQEEGTNHESKIDHESKTDHESKIDDESKLDHESEPDDEPVVLRRHKREPSQEEEDVSVRSRIKAFEVKPTNQSSPEGKNHVTKKRPESEAFKVFENKGILIGMGRTPKPKVTIEEENDDQDDDDNEKSPTLRKISPAVSPKPSKSPAVSPKLSTESDKRLFPDNPDVVIASEDEDDEFAVIKRESAVLKSFTKAAAPKTRNRTSQAIGGRRARATNSPAPKPVSMIEEKSEEKDESSPLLKKNDSDDFTTTEDTQKTVEPVTDKKSVTKRSKKETVASSNEADKKTSPVLETSPVSQSNIDTSGNIFLQIDPTAKRRSTGSTPVESPEKESSTTERPKSSHEVTSSPQPSRKPSPKPAQDDELMKALSARLRKQSPSKEKANEL